MCWAINNHLGVYYKVVKSIKVLVVRNVALTISALPEKFSLV